MLFRSYSFAQVELEGGPDDKNPLVRVAVAKALARLSQTQISFSLAEGSTSVSDALDSLDETSVGIQRPRWRVLAPAQA